MSVGKSMGLELRFFGTWTWRTGETALPRLRSRQGQWLLALLVLKRASPIERAWLSATLWPESNDTQALYNLRRNLSDLRQALGGDAWRLQSPTPRTLSLDLSGAECDLIEFDEAIIRQDAASLERAAALYQGPLLLGCLEEWVVPERTSREEAVLNALETLAGRSESAGSAAAPLRRALEIDPLRESAVRGLMTALAAEGSHAAAAEAYRAFRQRLHDEMNAEPDALTVSLFQEIRAEGRQGTVRRSGASRAATPRTATSKGHLPTPLTPLIGRTREIREVAACLDRSRLVTLTGTGGIGKTRLALAVAQEIGGEFLEGAWFVDLAPLADPKLMVQAVLSALHVQEQAGRSPSEILVEFLRPKRLLLVLDNCEHLVSACAHLAQALLQECPGLHILATSRETLQVTGEMAWRVPSLSLPFGPTPPFESEAVRLFVDRARQTSPGWTPSMQEYGEIAAICRRLDGIPLAIEMAAARKRAMTATQIAARLDDRFRLLTNAGTEFLPRQQTLRATLDWSYDLLNEEERTLLARLSVFAGGWTLEAAEAVCADAEDQRGMPGLKPDVILDVLARLVDQSLVFYEENDGVGRYYLLETVRQYGWERLRESGYLPRANEAHRDYFLHYAEEAQAHLTGLEQSDWLDRLEAEHDNLRAALASSLESGRDTAAGLRLSGALARFWRVRGHLSEGRAFLSAALQASGPPPPLGIWLEALRGEANLALSQGHYVEAYDLFEQAAVACRRVGDRRGEAAALGDLGAVRSSQGEYAAARGLLEQALALNRELGNREEETANLGSLGYLARETGDLEAAEAFLTQAVALSRKQGDTLAEGSNLGSLAYVFLQRGDRDEAQRLLERTLSLYRELGNRLGEAWTLSSLGHVAAERGDVSGAISLLEQALEINRAVGNRAGEAWNLNTLGGFQTRMGQHAKAQEMLKAALQIDQETGSRSNEAWTRQRLGDAALSMGDTAAAGAFYAEALELMQSLGIQHGVTAVQDAIAGLSALRPEPLPGARRKDGVPPKSRRAG